MRILLLSSFCVLLCSCSGNWRTIELPSSTKVQDVAYGTLFAPFTIDQLLDPLSLDEEPVDTGSDSKGKDYVFWKEYRGHNGRIRVYDEHYETDYGWVDAQWIEIYPGQMYLGDVVNEEYLSGVSRHDDEWILSFTTTEHKWFLTLSLDGKVVQAVSYTPR